ncbi:hypothetical protein LTR65_005274 [Meristemomyces frigidus]
MLGILNGAIRQQHKGEHRISGLIASKAIRSEVAPMYYRVNAHRVYTSIQDIKIASDWLADTINLCGGLPQRLVFTILDPSWSNFEKLLPLAEVARDPGMSPALLRLMITGRGGSRLLSVLGEATGLGRQAHAAGTTALEFQQYFHKWVTEVRGRPHVKQIEKHRLRMAKKRRSNASSIPVRSG